MVRLLGHGLGDEGQDHVPSQIELDLARQGDEVARRLQIARSPVHFHFVGHHDDFAGLRAHIGLVADLLARAGKVVALAQVAE